MRPSPMDTTPGAAVRTVVVHLLAPPPAACGLNGCRLRTTNVPSSFSSSGDILTYVIVLVLCFLLCALVLTFAVRCFLRDQPPPLPLGHPPPPAGQGEAEPKPAGEAAAPPLAAAALMVFSPGVELAGAEADCAICLTEFVGGEEIRVLKSCRHGFHDQCIQRWLSSKTSCPTCRSSCVVHCSEDEDGTAHCSENGGTAASLPQRVAEQV
ncbi:hypothetical protein ACJRO7_019942 [Eucalyptus globulus]|uniref:RING-type E3 ubiquitin transferase n=1 Tax=Eucalyptus globulus TaxID=34317 RepID=A0ABD3KH54_EUCGL